MLQKENYILNEYNRLTGRHLEPLMKRCSHDRWQWASHVQPYSWKSEQTADIARTLSCNQTGRLFLFTVVLPILKCTDTWQQTNFCNTGCEGERVFNIKWKRKKKKSVHFHCNILLKSALRRRSQLCMKDRKSSSFLLHKYFVPSLHCIWDRMFRKVPCFSTVTSRQTLK